MKHIRQFIYLSLGWLMASVACRYIWEYIDPWIGLILMVVTAYSFIALFYKLFK